MSTGRGGGHLSLPEGEVGVYGLWGRNDMFGVIMLVISAVNAEKGYCVFVFKHFCNFD